MKRNEAARRAESGTGLRQAMAPAERGIILDALHAHAWNRQDTSDALGINRTTLYKKMKRYEISYEAEMAKALA